MRRLWPLAIVACLSLRAPSTALAMPMFMGLGDLPGGQSYSFADDVSDDGTTVVGRSNSSSGPEAFRWAEKGVAWRDLDPGLEPPEAAVASAEEMAAVRAAAGQADLLGETDLPGDVGIGDLLDGTTAEERAQDRLSLRTERDSARVLVRPRDYRVLEARPR